MKNFLHWCRNWDRDRWRSEREN